MMTQRTVFLGLAVAAAGVAAGGPRPAAAQAAELQRLEVDPIVDVEWLLEHLDDPEVVVLHAAPREGRFEAEHIVGARPLALADIAWEGEHGWIVEFREIDELVEALRAVGVNEDSKVILYGQSMTSTARTWVTFDYLGLGDQAFVLNGGLDAWKAAGGGVAEGLPDGVGRGNVSARAPLDFRVSADWIHERLDDESVVLLDARPDDEYTGEDGGMGGMANPGHIPGAAQLYWEELMDGESNTRFRPRAEIADILAAHGAEQGKTHVSYCMIGLRASVNYMAARMFGLDVYFYDGSWHDWGTRDDLPTVQGQDPGNR